MPQDYFRALRDVALAINASLDPKDVLHKISEHTAQTMNCKACTIRLLDSTGHFLLPSARLRPLRHLHAQRPRGSETQRPGQRSAVRQGHPPEGRHL